jgi:ParB-like chromosome segregation protein Spo0J
VAADAAGTAALAEMAQALETARETGRMILDLSLEQITPDHLSRDRLPVEDEEMAALRESIRAHGQRTPVEVTPLTGPLPYGLISGWRRLVALKALHVDTGEARFATIQAIVRQPETVADAYVNMVEENEIRVGLSHYERARVAALATERGVFENEKKALLALFGNASRAKRSRIRAFLRIYHALDGVLRYPAHLPERLGLRLAERLREGGSRALAHAVSQASPASPEAELALLERLLRGPVPRAAAKPASQPVLPGVSLEEKLTGQTLILKLKGPGVTPDLARQIRALMTELRPLE